MIGWHHQLNGHGFGWTLGVGDGQGGLACCGPWGHKESDTTERLNRTLCQVSFQRSIRCPEPGECGSQTSHWDCKDKIDLCPQRLCSDNALLSWSRSVGSHRSVPSPQLSTLGTLRQVL